jgi:nucleotide-binding universal stress UspA family protein
MNLPSPVPGRFRNILFCTDFSESADAAFEFALDAALRRPGSTLHLLHVIHEPEAQFWKSYLYEVDNLDAESRRTLDERVATIYRSRAPSGLDLQVDYRVGPDAATILEFARLRKVDLIVLGRHGHSGMGKALFGSVAEKVVRKADCAVLVIPLSYARSESTPPSSGSNTTAANSSAAVGPNTPAS